MDNQFKSLIDKINTTPYMGYFAITGGGSRFISDFLEVGGGSDTVVGVNIPYNQSMVEEFIDESPEKFVSEETALLLANTSMWKAYKVAEGKAFGLGVTASLSKTGNEREDREHQIFIVGMRYDKTVIKSTTLQRGRTRTHEEAIVAWNIFKVLAELLDVEFDIPDYFGLSVQRAGENISTRTIPALITYPNWVYHVNFEKDNQERDLAIFPGSFNPIHHGHREIKELVEKNLGFKVVYELSVKNIDKGEITDEELNKRIDLIGEQTMVTTAATFKDKIDLLGDKTTFIVGADTFYRIANLKYNTIQDIETWVEKEISFIVIPRYGRNWADALADVEKLEHVKLFEQLLIGEYQDIADNINVDISSTQLRK
jgi:nicotinic acid mononucleotide adenylyltransferase